MDIVSLKKECEHLFEMAEATLKWQEYLLEQWKKTIALYDTIALWGTGFDARLLIDFLKDVLPGKEVIFIDNDASKHGKEICDGYMCYGKERLYGCNPSTTIILIASSWYANAIMTELGVFPEPGTGLPSAPSQYLKAQLGATFISTNFIKLLVATNQVRVGLSCKLGVKLKLLKALELFRDIDSVSVFHHRMLVYLGNIQPMKHVETHPQYFPLEIKSRFTKDEVFLDCGAASGDSIKDFVEQSGNCFKAVYSFEMDDDIFEALASNPLTRDSRVTIIHAGVSNENKYVKYNKIACPTYKNLYGAELEGEAELKSIDSLVDDGTIKEKVTFVKMDIEGAEMDALRGMEKLMKRDRPKLAICVYHKPEDLWEIPLYIKHIVPEYTFILRHHSHDTSETVLYAYIE